MGQYSVEKESLEQAYHIRKRILGEEHPITISTLMELQRIQHIRNRTEDDLFISEADGIISQGIKHFPQMDYGEIQEIDTVKQFISDSNSINKPFVRAHKKFGRNEICPCGRNSKIVV